MIVHVLIGLLLLFPVSAAATVTIDFERVDAFVREKFSDRRVSTVHRWQEALKSLPESMDDKEIARVSRFIHREITYMVDEKLYGTEDYWATPSETLGHGKGDCEDFAILAYVSLRHAGISDHQLRLIYVNATVRDGRVSVSGAHMVLGYYPKPGGEPWIIDSLMENILPASRRTDLRPVFSFNATGMWVGTAPAGHAGLSRWRDVLNRMRLEGIEFHND